MRVRILAVGTRMPGWVTTAYEDYTRRMRKDMRVDLEEIPVGRVKADEEKRLLERIGDDYLVALDERGKSLTTLQLAKWLGERQQDGRNLTFVIGGPDGLGPNVLLKAALRWSLSALTFPHAMVRVILAEQLYRAHSVLQNHPYHRE
ncbi:MAG TPA: 23S rRNA (pseudouridine(1915)-N(3))-methyltransferase RlmH [Steroidobacteraceae bacterium]|jgi:23S rRNA (pseudouridine1915-N3)-methyltransferase|nr:23S rRNA (pseudouridine(1915)-N(3))-methyltransferase RlmH [Steroidobacteraceae bacterium]